jgi:hypothetical protein
MKLGSNWSVTEGLFDKSDSWVPILINPLNQSFTDIYNALNSNLTIGDNIVGTKQVVKFKTSATYTSGSFTNISFIWPGSVKNPPFEIRVGKVEVPSFQSVILTSVTVNRWIFNAASSTISIQYITGLANSSTYTINIIAQ